ncbi:MAG: hypothetical protein ACQKBV_07715, partial [Puniceicoccales bacterium]
MVPGAKEDVVLVSNRGSRNKAYDGRPEIKPEVWYSIWVTIDNSRDEQRFYIEGGDFAKRTELTEFTDETQRFLPFQSKGAMELRHFVISCPVGAEGETPRTIQVDDINFMLQSPTSAIADVN